MVTEKQEGSFASMFEEATRSPARAARLRVGQRIEAVVVQIGKDSVFVETDGKQQAFLEVVELRDAEGNLTVAVGDVVRAQVVDVDERAGIVRLARSAGKPGNAAALEQAKEAGLPVEGKVTTVNKGGIEVEIAGLRAFCPMSQIDTRRVEAEEVKGLVGQMLRFLVTEVKDGGKSVVLSRRALLARENGAERASAADEGWAELSVQQGQVVLGSVQRMTEFGAFVRIGKNVDGLLHVSELKGAKPEAGKEMLVVVRKIDRGTKKISLSLAPEGAAVGTILPTTKIAVGSVVTGIVTRHETFGIFVQVEGTSDRAGRGLIPNVELGVPRGADLRKAFPEGSKVTAKVLEAGDRMRLSIKGARDAEERADFEAARGKANAPASLGTFADLLKGRKL